MRIKLSEYNKNEISFVLMILGFTLLGSFFTSWLTRGLWWALVVSLFAGAVGAAAILYRWHKGFNGL